MKSQMFQLQDLEKKSVKSYEIFRSTALAFLKKHGCPPEEYQKEILSMWSLVMGLSDMLAYKIHRILKGCVENGRGNHTSGNQASLYEVCLSQLAI